MSKHVIFARAAIVVAAILLSGCAAFPEQGRTLADNVDIAKVNAIDHAALQRGVMVKWVNYPQLDPSKQAKAVGS